MPTAHPYLHFPALGAFPLLIIAGVSVILSLFITQAVLHSREAWCAVLFVLTAFLYFCRQMGILVFFYTSSGVGWEFEAFSRGFFFFLKTSFHLSQL